VPPVNVAISGFAPPLDEAGNSFRGLTGIADVVATPQLSIINN
jgi:glutaminase